MPITLRRRTLSKTIRVTAAGQVHSGMLRLPPSAVLLTGLTAISSEIVGISNPLPGATWRRYLMASLAPAGATLQQAYDAGLETAPTAIKFAIGTDSWFIQNVTALAGQHIWVMLSYDALELDGERFLEFQIDGWDDGFELVGSAALNQDIGGTLNYHVYRSAIPGLGAVALKTKIVLA